MNLNHALHKFRKSTELHSTADTLLRGYKLVIARVVWLTLFCSILIVFILGIPEAFKIALSLRPDTVAGLEQLGLPASFPAIYTLTIDTVTILVFACILAQLTEQLLGVVQETMQPAHVSLWLRQPEGHENKRATRVLPKIGE